MGGSTIQVGDLQRILGLYMPLITGTVASTPSPTTTTATLTGTTIVGDVSGSTALIGGVLTAITANTGNALTFTALASAPTAGAVVSIFPGARSTFTIGGATIQLPTDMQGVYQPAADSTTALLTSGATYTGAAFDITNARGIVGSIYADQVGLAQVQQSPDGTNWDLARYINYGGVSKGRSFAVSVFQPGGKYARLIFKNNGSATQTEFRFYARTTPLPVQDDPSPTAFLATSGFSITAGSTTFAPTKAIEATTASGTAAVTFEDGTTATVYLIQGVPKPVSVTNVASSGTTATGIVGYY